MEEALSILDESHLTEGTSSPFLPGTKIQFAWDSTSLGLLKTCPRLYQYTILEGYIPKSESIHLRFGIEYHTALQEYDVSRANGISHEDSIHDVVANLVRRTHDWRPDPESKAGRYKNRDSIVSLVVDYLDHFADDPAETYIKSDGTAAVELSFRFELDFGPTDSVKYMLSGHLDRVVRFNDQLLVVDHKTTTTTIGSYYFDQWEPNNQMTLYTLAGSIVLDTPIKGVIIDAAQILLDQPNRFVRGFTYRTQDQLNEWLQSLDTFLALNEVYAVNDFWPMNDMSCDKYGGCKFRGICSKSPQVRELFLKSDFIKQEPDERWNPLKAR